MPMSCDEPYYCSQQIDIPPDLPDIMKQFTKAAIRTQPKDVLGWATAYFMALYKGEEPPVKERYEMPKATQKTDTGLTIGLLKILNKQLSDKELVTAEIIEEKWKELSLPKEQLDELLKTGDLHGSFQWDKFIALAASALAEIAKHFAVELPNLICIFIGSREIRMPILHKERGALNKRSFLIINNNQCEAMLLQDDIEIALKKLCEITTDDLEGGPSRIKLEKFIFFYTFLAGLDEDIPPEYVTEVVDYFKSVSEHHEGYVQPSFFTVTNCPCLCPKK